MILLDTNFCITIINNNKPPAVLALFQQYVPVGRHCPEQRGGRRVGVWGGQEWLGSQPQGVGDVSGPVEHSPLRRCSRLGLW